MHNKNIKETQKHKIVRKMKNGIIFIFSLFLLFASFPISYLIYGRKQLWIISEVDFDARDNGFHFFKYVRNFYPNINCFYIISKNNPYYLKVKQLGNTVEPHSYKHLLMFISAKAKISTCVHGCSPSWAVTKLLSKYHFTGLNIALKHGIFKNIHPNYFKNNAHLDLICCGSKPEYDFIKTSFGYKENAVSYTGLARFDALHNLKHSKTILIMPTWRRWLDSVLTINDFEQSDFFAKWHSLLSNKNFVALVEKYSLSICFYVHPKLNKYIDSFKSENCNISFFNSISGDSLQNQIKKSLLLITDYSSVFFDFAYMRRPTIFYQFDEKDYFYKHYAPGYFDYRRDGYGDVCTNLDDVIESFIKLSKNSFQVEEKYLKRIESSFLYYDQKNCERIFSVISKLVVERRR